MPLYILGLKGMTRRMNHYANPDWQPYLVVALIGAVIIAMGIFFTVLQLYVSVRDRNKLTAIPAATRGVAAPWSGRSARQHLSTTSPWYRGSPSWTSSGKTNKTESLTCSLPSTKTFICPATPASV